MDSEPSVDAILVDQLYIGNLHAATSEKSRDTLGITHTLSICAGYASTGPNHLVLNIDDSEYSDLLIRLPDAVNFIENALDDPENKVLVHCLFGVSRSAAVVAAYIMKTRGLSRKEALSLIREHRPQIHPNYGFLKQLDVFAQCSYNPCPSNAAYTSWKRTHKQKMRPFIALLDDTTQVVPKCLYLTSEFPEDEDQAECLLYELEATHIVTIPPTELPALPSHVLHHPISSTMEGCDISSSLLDSATLIENILLARNGQNRVLIHSLSESRACILTAAFLMLSKALTAKDALLELSEVLPLFYPTTATQRHLTSFERYLTRRNSPLPPSTPTLLPSTLITSRTSKEEIANAIRSVAATMLSDAGAPDRGYGDVSAALTGKSAVVKDVEKQEMATTLAI